MKTKFIFLFNLMLICLNGYGQEFNDPANSTNVFGGNILAAPANDNCSGATTIYSSPSCSYTSGTIYQATQSLVPTSCDGYTSTLCNDVWYRFKAASTSHTITVVPSTGLDAVVNLRSGACNGSNVDCQDNAGGEGGTEVLSATGLTVGNYYYIRVYDYTGSSIQPTTYTFNICVTHTPAPCSITSLSPSSETHSAEAFSTTPGGDDIIVNGQAYCTYTVTNSCNWVTVTPMSGSMNQVGQVLINYSITAWNGTSPRTCTFYINGSPFTITQNGCSNDFYDGTESATATGKTYNLDIDAYSACAWSITNPCSSWITLNQSSGTGESTISVTVAPNTACSTRTCTLTINPGNETHVITQAGNATPSISFSPTSPHFCQGLGPVSVTASGATSYSWVPSTGLSNTTIANPSANPSSTTTYTVTGTTSGCTGSSTVTITVNPPASISVTPTNPSFCTGTSGVQLTATGGSGSNYSWTPSTGLSNSNIANPVASPASNTTYTVTGTNTNGCTGSTTVNVAIHIPPTINVTPSNQSICTGGSIQLSASGANTYTWAPATGLNTSSGSLVTASPTTLGPHTYTVTGTDSYGCTNTTTVTVTVTTSPTVTISANVPTPYCQGQTIVLTPSTTGASYLWTPNYQTTGSINVTSSGTFTVAVTNPPGCTGTYTSAPFPVAINSNPAVPFITATPNPGCTGQLVTFSTTSPGPIYSWTGPNGFTYTIQNPPPIISVGIQNAGNYSLTVTNNEGCSSVSNVINLVINDTNVAITGNPHICSGQFDTLTATQGASYLWSPGNQTTQSIIINTAGTYTVTVTNPSFCNGSAKSAFKVVTSSPTPPIPSININIVGGGHINLVASPTTGYNYQWYLNMTGVNNPVGTNGSILFNADSMGYYSVNISDISSGCNSWSGLVFFPWGIDEENSSDIIFIHPNPANDKLYIEYKSLSSGQKGEYMIYDNQGKMVLKQPFDQVITEINISDLAKGLYFIRVECGNSRLIRKMVKE